jgi:hypothetical protein
VANGGEGIRLNCWKMDWEKLPELRGIWEAGNKEENGENGNDKIEVEAIFNKFTVPIFSKQIRAIPLAPFPSNSLELANWVRTHFERSPTFSCLNFAKMPSKQLMPMPLEGLKWELF